MGSQLDFVRKKFAPLQAKTLKNALARQIALEFPRIGGPRIRGLCAEMILEIVARHCHPRDAVRHGQVLWLAISVEDRPKYRQRIADTRLVPVLLDLCTPDDVQARIDRVAIERRLLTRAVRLCDQAHAQGGLLSNCDLAELLGTQDSRVAHVLAEHERKSGQLVPRRATLHDVGTGLTHKRLICRKRYLEGKEPHLVAQETWHSLEAVDRYLGQFDRVRHCRQQGLSAEETAHILDCTVRLVEQYLAIDREIEEARHA